MKRVISGLLTAVMCLSLFFVTGLEAKAEGQINISIEYFYVNSEGKNAITTKNATVEEGTTWGEFLENDDMSQYWNFLKNTQRM